jgi:hypothetical protein
MLPVASPSRRLNTAADRTQASKENLGHSRAKSNRKIVTNPKTVMSQNVGNHFYSTFSFYRGEVRFE